MMKVAPLLSPKMSRLGHKPSFDTKTYVGSVPFPRTLSALQITQYQIP